MSAPRERKSTDRPAQDQKGDLERLLRQNEQYRCSPWPDPFDVTRHVLRRGDPAGLSWLPDGSVHLVVTAPPPWNPGGRRRGGEPGEMESYAAYLAMLDPVWAECARVLAPGGRLCCVAGEVAVQRRNHGRHYVMPLPADIQVRMRRTGLDCLAPVLWLGGAHAVAEGEGTGALFSGTPYQPGAVIRGGAVSVLFFRKPGGYRSPTAMQKALSMLNRREMSAWLRPVWTDLRGGPHEGRAEILPQALAERLIRLFSFAGDTVFDPFAATAATARAAVESGRNSAGCVAEARAFTSAAARLRAAAGQERLLGATRAEVEIVEGKG